ncbi:Replication-associated recombination protein A [BD1-7 clade bacterium]|uniref:Replication-associated recombination protein A n=1 Tax=BD1-7 clade bacterium TaxID=2029982 RepID=A0A5S9QL41_9GAMM|nr:Replication-associated recombination protein A [BD1-7 clade bacterium]
MRPKTLSSYIGQAHILGPERPLTRAIESGHIHSMILWGPPGVGKTSLAKLIANHCSADFVEISAVLAGVKDIRAAVEKARMQRIQYQRSTILFVDEVHRFNKSQQDAFLPHIENGDVIFVGATTENPSFELNAALLSRARVYVLKPIDHDDLRTLVNNALSDDPLLQDENLSVDNESIELLIRAGDGDARRVLNLLEVAIDICTEEAGSKTLTPQIIEEVMGHSLRRFDKGGEQFYDQISAMHKSIRGSDPDAALYWMCRMLDGGCDSLYLARRLVRTASEDIGNADPRGVNLALDAWMILERLGSPEGELALAQAVVYLASAPKSNAVYKAYNETRSLIQKTGNLEVPNHIRNAPTALMKELDYGKGYRYAHDEPNAFAAGEVYMPEALNGHRTYFPVERGLEKKISEKLEHLRQLNDKSQDKRYE